MIVCLSHVQQFRNSSLISCGNFTLKVYLFSISSWYETCLDEKRTIVVIPISLWHLLADETQKENQSVVDTKETSHNCYSVWRVRQHYARFRRDKTYYTAFGKITRVLRTLWLDEPHFLSKYRDMDDVIFILH